MSNKFETFLADIGKGIEDAVSHVDGIAAKVEQIVTDEKAVTAPFVADLKTVVSDIEKLVTEVKGALTGGTVNLAVGTAAYQAVLQIVADFTPFAVVVEDAVAILEKDI